MIVFWFDNSLWLNALWNLHVTHLYFLQMHVQYYRCCQRTTQGINDEYLELFYPKYKIISLCQVNKRTIEKAFRLLHKSIMSSRINIQSCFISYKRQLVQART